MVHVLALLLRLLVVLLDFLEEGGQDVRFLLLRGLRFLLRLRVLLLGLALLGQVLLVVGEAGGVGLLFARFVGVLGALLAGLLGLHRVLPLQNLRHLLGQLFRLLQLLSDFVLE